MVLMVFLFVDSSFLVGQILSELQVGQTRLLAMTMMLQLMNLVGYAVLMS